jgi:hypothetical protein
VGNFSREFDDSTVTVWRFIRDAFALRKSEVILAHRRGHNALDGAQPKALANWLAGIEEGISQIMRPVCPATVEV